MLIVLVSVSIILRLIYVNLNSVKEIMAAYFPLCVSMLWFQKTFVWSRGKAPEETSGGKVLVTFYTW